MSRRFFKIAFVVVLLPVVALIRVAMEPQVGRKEFEERMHVFFKDTGFEVMWKTTEEAKLVPLPFYQHMRSIFAWRGSGVKVATGFPDSVLRWNIARVGGPGFKILVRYYEGNAVRMIIFSYPAAAKERRALGTEIEKVFPSLKITFEDVCPPQRARELPDH